MKFKLFIDLTSSLSKYGLGKFEIEEKILFQNVPMDQFEIEHHSKFLHGTSGWVDLNI